VGAAEQPESSSTGSRSSPLLKALPAKDRPTLRRLKGNGSFLATGGTVGASFHLRTLWRRNWSQRRVPFGFAGFATLGLVLELFVVEEQLFARRKDEVGAAVNTLENLVLEFHGELLPSARDSQAMDGVDL